MKQYEKKENQTTEAQTVEQLKSCFKQERTQVHLKTCNNQYPQLPNDQKVYLKGKPM